MIIKFKIRKIVAPFLILSLFSFAESTTTILEIETYLSTNGIYAGGEFHAAVIVKMKDSWHINSATPLDEFAIPTEVRIKKSDDINIKEVKYPAHKTKIFSFLDEPIAVYEDSAIIYISGSVSKNIHDKLILEGNLSY